MPWLFDDEAVDVLRRFTRLKHRLMPYLYGAAVIAHEAGIPVMRPMAADFPDDPACAHFDRQYLLGGDLLVAPVFSADGDVWYCVPAGRWTHLLGGKVVAGPGWVQERHGFDSVPVLARPGSVIAVGARDDRPDYDYADGVTLHVYQLGDDATAQVTVPTLTGEVAATFDVHRHGRELSIERSGAPAPWRVLLVGVSSVASVHGGTLSATPEALGSRSAPRSRAARSSSRTLSPTGRSP